MKVWNLLVAAAAAGVIGLVADTAAAQVDVKPGGVTVTGQAGNNLNVPFNGQAPSVTQPGTAGTFTPGTPGTYLPGTTQPYPGYSTYPGTYYQGQQIPGYVNPSFPGYQVMPSQYGSSGYSYYTPGGQVAPTSGYYAPAAAGAGCCGATAAAPMYSQPVAYAGGACCETHRKRGLFRRR